MDTHHVCCFCCRYASFEQLKIKLNEKDFPADNSQSNAVIELYLLSNQNFTASIGVSLHNAQLRPLDTTY